MGEIKNLKDKISGEYNKYKNLSYILIYFLVTGLVFIYGFWNDGALMGQWGVIFAIFIPICLILKLRSLKYINLLSWVFPLLGFFSILILLWVKCKELCSSFSIYSSLIPIIGNLWLFNFILYNEKIGEIPPNKLSFVHARYLEYLKNYIWVVIFGVFGYYTWQFNKELSEFVIKEESIKKAFISVMSSSTCYPLWKSLFQVGASSFAGVILIFHAFHFKLKEIENAIKIEDIKK